MQGRQATARSVTHPLPCTTTTVTLLQGQLNLSKSKLRALSRAGHDRIARYCFLPVSVHVVAVRLSNLGVAFSALGSRDDSLSQPSPIPRGAGP